LAKTGQGLIYSITTPIAKPTGSATVLAYTENELAGMNDCVYAGVPPLNMALALALQVTRDNSRRLTGRMTITKAPDESDLTQYRLYWATNATYVIVLTANAWAEMDKGASRERPR
jgi:hypothetical protein